MHSRSEYEPGAQLQDRRTMARTGGSATYQNTKPFVGQLNLDSEGYIIGNGGARTNIEGVFHAGDVEDRVYKQAITAAGAGCKAAMEAERFLEAEGH